MARRSWLSFRFVLLATALLGAGCGKRAESGAAQTEGADPAATEANQPNLKWQDISDLPLYLRGGYVCYLGRSDGNSFELPPRAQQLFESLKPLHELSKEGAPEAKIWELAFGSYVNGARKYALRAVANLDEEYQNLTYKRTNVLPIRIAHPDGPLTDIIQATYGTTDDQFLIARWWVDRSPDAFTKLWAHYGRDELAKLDLWEGKWLIAANPWFGDDGQPLDRWGRFYMWEPPVDPEGRW